jgi:hypothetical protein
MSFSPFVLDASEIPVLEHMLAGGAVFAAQLPTASRWTPERRLAGTVLAAALVEVRDHHQKREYLRAIGQDLEWIFSEEQNWPFSFVRLCDAFGVEPEYVRALVLRWLRPQPRSPGEARRRRAVVRRASA